MSDFNRNDDLNNRERDLRVVQEKDSGLGAIAGIAVIVLLLLGGLLFYFNPGSVRTADNSVTSNTPAPITTPQRSPMSPAAPSASPETPAPATAPSTTPAQ